jgi:hypothetical protein
MGFFKAFGLDFGNSPGEAKGSETYLPITMVSIKDLQTEATLKHMHVVEFVETHARRIAQLLIQEDKSDLVDTLTYGLAIHSLPSCAQ